MIRSKSTKEFTNHCRWHNVLPVDSTRVILSPKVRQETDYINANHVVVPEAQRAYILSQGPLDETLADFWAMVWQQNCRAIVMLCKTVEGGMCKCAHYWPINPSHASNSSAKPLRLEEIGLEIRVSYILQKYPPSFGSEVKIN